MDVILCEWYLDISKYTQVSKLVPRKDENLPGTYDIHMQLIVIWNSIFTRPTKQDSDSNDNQDADEEFTEQQSP